MGCEVGRYGNITGGTMCHMCASGMSTKTNETGATAATQCFKCPIGKSTLNGEKTWGGKPNPGAKPCEYCSKNTYQNESGQVECKSCPRGKGTRPDDTPLGSNEKERTSQKVCNYPVETPYNPKTDW